MIDCTPPRELEFAKTHTADSGLAGSSRRRSILEHQHALLAAAVQDAGGWRQALFLPSGDVDLGVNLAVWSEPNQLLMLAEIKSYLEAKLDEQFATLSAEKDKFRLLVMEGRQMLEDEHHAVVEEQARSLQLKAALDEERGNVAELERRLAEQGGAAGELAALRETRQRAARLLVTGGAAAVSLGELCADVLPTAEEEAEEEEAGGEAGGGAGALEEVAAARAAAEALVGVGKCLAEDGAAAPGGLAALPAAAMDALLERGVEVQRQLSAAVRSLARSLAATTIVVLSRLLLLTD